MPKKLTKVTVGFFIPFNNWTRINADRTDKNRFLFKNPFLSVLSALIHVPYYPLVHASWEPL